MQPLRYYNCPLRRLSWLDTQPEDTLKEIQDPQNTLATLSLIIGMELERWSHLVIVRQEFSQSNKSTY